MTITYTHKHINEKSKTLAASLLLYGFQETTTFGHLQDNHYILAYKFNPKNSLTTKSICVLIHKPIARYRIFLCNYTTKPITKNSLTTILNLIDN